MWDGFDLDVTDVGAAVTDFMAIPAVLGLIAIVLALPFVRKGVSTLRSAVGRR